MSVRTFPALGFDPAPGSPAAVLAQSREADRAARALAGAATAAARLGADWQGSAASAYSAETRALPRDLQQAAAAHGTLSRELAAYADDLAARQLRATDLESRAAAARARIALYGAAGVPGTTDHGAGGSVYGGPARRHDGGGSSALHARAAGEYGAPATGRGADGPVGRRGEAGPVDGRGAGGTASSVALAERAELEAVLSEARRLLAEHRDSAARSAARIRAAAADPPYRKPGVLARVREGVRTWVTRHADVLTQISHDLRGISAALGTMSLVPGFQFLAPIAIAAGATAVAIDVVVAASTGRGSWPGLATDAILTVLPTGPATRVLRTVPGVTRGLKAVNRAIPAGVRGQVFRTVRNLPEGISADQLAAAARRIRTDAPGLTGDVVVQGSRAGHSAGAGSDIDFGLRVPPEHYERLLRDAFGESSTREAAANAATRGRIFWRHAGLKNLHDALQDDLGRKVDLAIIKQGGLFDNEPWLRVP
ncbi:MAG TPA: hypothetical protein VGP36_02890 [Mycobacteriales bacterium]|nr:hypothetical protein [Mycobacteriales bacterium]